MKVYRVAKYNDTLNGPFNNYELLNGQFKTLHSRYRLFDATVRVYNETPEYHGILLHGCTELFELINWFVGLFNELYKKGYRVYELEVDGFHLELDQQILFFADSIVDKREINMSKYLEYDKILLNKLVKLIPFVLYRQTKMGVFNLSKEELNILGIERNTTWMQFVTQAIVE